MRLSLSHRRSSRSACPDFLWPDSISIKQTSWTNYRCHLNLFHGHLKDSPRPHQPLPSKIETASVSPRTNRSATTASGSLPDRRPTAPASGHRKGYQGVQETGIRRQGKPPRAAAAVDSPLRGGSIPLWFLWSGKRWLGVFGKAKIRAVLLRLVLEGHVKYDAVFLGCVCPSHVYGKCAP